MIIVTIKFGKSSKTYDYLALNPETHGFSTKRKASMVFGVLGPSIEKVFFTDVRIVKRREENTLPSHVTKALMMKSGKYLLVSPIAKNN